MPPDCWRFVAKRDGQAAILFMKTVYFMVNGIATLPGNQKNWNARAVSWIHQDKDHYRAGHRAQLDEYFTTALTVWIHSHERAETFAKLLNQFYGWRIIIVAHSNGCHVALDAMRIAHSVKIHALHLVAGAVDGNFRRNGLNWMLKKGQVGDVRIYRGGRDWAMRLCCLIAGKLLFAISLRDKPLGLAGAKDVDPVVADQVMEIIEPAFGHSDWWHPDNFNRTMKRF